MATDYASTYVPPMPVLEVRLGSAEAAPDGPRLLALIDTGADICIVPRLILARFDLSAGETVWIRSQWGEPLPLIRYQVDLHTAYGVLPGIDVVSDPDGREVILGRNALNKLRLVLDGPAQTVDILDHKPKPRK